MLHLRLLKYCSPLDQLTEGKQRWKEAGAIAMDGRANVAFQHLRDTFANALFLRHYDPNEKLCLKTDALGYGLGAVLLQQDQDGHWRPVAFWSRKLTHSEQNCKVHDQELLAIVAAMKQWRHYLEGSLHTIAVFTDHNNLKGFMKQKELNSRQARWALKLAAYDFEIFHRAGKLNPADAPSRRLDYKGASPLNTKLLLTLQNKLAL